jgi:tRNA A37 threonylcarbamoyladenosine synthetase subunit TsaC/SUA5/YrdC
MSPGDAARYVVAVIRQGGLAVVPLDVSYAFLAGSRGSLHRIFELKLRPMSRPCPILASWGHFVDISAGNRRSDIGRIEPVVNEGLPVGVVTTPDWHSRVGRTIPADCVELLVREEKLALFMNMGGMGDELIKTADGEEILLFGSSANISGKGNSFSLSDVPPPMLDAVDIVCEAGTCKYANPQRLASTIVDLASGQLTRRGILADEIEGLLDHSPNITESDPASSKGGNGPRGDRRNFGGSSG